MGFEPDYIVVGAGAGGGVLASRLAEEGKNKVLLIEAGPDNSSSKWIQEGYRFLALYDLPWFYGAPFTSPSHWGFVTTPQEGKVYCYPRGTGLGGSVNHHAMVDGRGSPVVYDEWATITGDPDWSYEALEPLFRKMERYNVPGADPKLHGQDGWLNIHRSSPESEYQKELAQAAVETTGTDFVEDNIADPNTREGIYQVQCQMHPNGRRSYVATDLILPTYNRTRQLRWNNFEIKTDNLVTKVLFDGNRAIGVEVIDAPRAYQVDAAHKKSSITGRRKVYKAKKEVILSGGSINTAQLLLLSGIGPKDHLDEIGIPLLVDLPGVGSHLQDHLECAISFKLKYSPGEIFPIQALFASRLNPYWRKYVRPETKANYGGAMIIDCFSGIGKHDPLNPDLHIHCFNFPLRDFNLNPRKYRDKDPLKAADLSMLLKWGNPFKPLPVQSFLVETLHSPHDMGTVRLNSDDPTAQPTIDEDICHAEEEIARVAEGLELCRKIMQHQKLSEYVPEEYQPGPSYPDNVALKDYIKRYSSFGHHISGTAKMGPNHDPLAVLDNNLKVRGIMGLRVCDLSVCPSPPAYNPSRATYVIAESLADKIKRGL